MKKMIILFICLALGIALLTGCSSHDEAFIQKNYTAGEAQITAIRIDVRDRQIDVALSLDNQIHVDYFENDREYYDISVSGDRVLTMTSASDKGWADYIGGKSAAESRKISLRLPGTLLTNLELSTTNEDISLPALTVAGDLSLSSSGGSIVFDKLHVENTIRLHAKNGNISGAIIGSYEEYAISCDIKKGESNLPSSKEGGAKTLAVSSNNGNVDIAFVSE